VAGGAKGAARICGGAGTGFVGAFGALDGYAGAWLLDGGCTDSPAPRIPGNGVRDAPAP
jgi:hypothetical protein